MEIPIQSHTSGRRAPAGGTKRAPAMSTQKASTSMAAEWAAGEFYVSSRNLAGISPHGPLRRRWRRTLPLPKPASVKGMRLELMVTGGLMCGITTGGG